MFLLLGATIVGLLASLSRLSAESNVSNDHSAYRCFKISYAFFHRRGFWRKREKERWLFQWRCIYSSEIYRVTANEERKKEILKARETKEKGTGRKAEGRKDARQRGRNQLGRTMECVGEKKGGASERR